MDIQSVARALHPLERKVLPHIAAAPSVAQLMRASGLSEVEVVRALQWLDGKKLIELSTTRQEVVVLGSNGRAYVAEGLPEKRLIRALENGPVDLRMLATVSGISEQEVKLSLGLLRREKRIDLVKNGELTLVSITGHGTASLKETSSIERFLQKIFPCPLSSLSAEEKSILKELLTRRDIIAIDIVTLHSATLTEAGKSVIAAGISSDAIEQLTPDIIASGAWRSKPLRGYDVVSPVPALFPGKKQAYRQFLDSVRRRFQALGFQEMTGPLVETDFWDMDVLFMPQFHSARDIHDAYFVKEPSHAHSLPTELVEKVRQAHENGFGTGSKGWRYPFDMRRTYRHLLRTQGTACSARMLASPELKIPGKYFGIARCFRYDVVDATHLADFYQVEGIVIEDGLTLRHLIGLLRMFAREFAGADEIKVTPSYFPFTEPSASLYAKHPQMGWIELGGSGIFRPEMMKPLGITQPVIAWGIGIDRLAMFKLGLRDIRELFSRNIERLREVA